MKPAKMEKYYENAYKKTEFKIAPIARAHECFFFVAPSLKISIELFLEVFCDTNHTHLQSSIPEKAYFLRNIFQCYAGVLTPPTR